MINQLPYVYDKEKNEVLPMFSDLRVTPHAKLEELYQVWNEEEKKWEDDTITKGCVQFDSRYDMPEAYGMSPSLTKKDDETREEWEARVSVRKAEIKKEWKDQFAEGDRRKALWKEYETPGVAYLYGQWKKKELIEELRDQDED